MIKIQETNIEWKSKFKQAEADYKFQQELI